MTLTSARPVRALGLALRIQLCRFFEPERRRIDFKDLRSENEPVDERDAPGYVGLARLWRGAPPRPKFRGADQGRLRRWRPGDSQASEFVDAAADMNKRGFGVIAVVADRGDRQANFEGRDGASFGAIGAIWNIGRPGLPAGEPGTYPAYPIHDSAQQRLGETVVRRGVGARDFHRSD